MANVRFNLKGKQREKELILLIFRYRRQRVVFSTGQTINPKYWDDKKMRVKRIARYPYAELNAYLDKLEYELLKAYRGFLADGEIPTTVQLKNHLYKLTGKSTGNQNDLFPFIDRFIKERSKLPQFATNTIKKYIYTKNKLLLYEKECNKKLKFRNVDLDFFYAFTAWMYEKNYSANYVRKHIRVLKTFLNDALDRGVSTYTFHKHKKFTVHAAKTDFVYLTKLEIKQLFEHECEDKENDLIRKLFVLACCTGLRFSDFTNLKQSHIRTIAKVELIDLVTIKTEQRVIIPLHPYVKAIIQNHDFKAAKTIENKDFNDQLKDICKEVGFDEMVYLNKNEGGKNVVKVLEKYKAITSHTGRRSFITNLRKEGELDANIMKMTGHTTTEQLQKYDKVKLEESAVRLASTSFFNVQLKAI